MNNGKINDRKLLRLIDREKMSQSAAARELGVSRQAISKRLQELRGKTTRIIVAKKVEKIVDDKIDTLEQLKTINGYANEILDLLMAWGRGDEVALQVLESQTKEKTVKVGAGRYGIKEIKFKDPRELALKAMAEIRGQLKLQLEIFQTIYSLQAVEEFQSEVIAAIGRADPGIRDKIIFNINQKRAIHQSAIKFT